MTETESSTVQKTVTVEANPDRAFHVFTAGIDTWWPKTHHIGTTPMKESRIEGRVGGRCYSVHQDGTAVDWGKVRLGTAAQTGAGVAGDSPMGL